MPVLTVKPKEGAPYSLKIEKTEITIGRSPSNALALDDHCCSGRHAAIFPSGGGFAVKDLGSKNGTAVNGRRITGEVKLKKGDKIRVGDTTILFGGESLTRSSKTVIPAEKVLNPASTVVSIDKPESSPADSRAAQLIDAANQALYCDQPLGEFLDRIMDVVIEFVPMDRGILMLKDENTGELIRKVVKVPDESRPLEELVISESIVKAALEKSSSLFIPDVGEDKGIGEAPSVILLKIHSAMCVPMLHGHEVIGVIYADRISVFGAFSEADLRDLTLLAGVAAARIREIRHRQQQDDQARLDKQLTMARVMQQNMLPKKDPVFEPFDISGSAWPCHQVGGDYFNFVDLGPDRLGIVIADVSGTGLCSGMLMFYLSGLLLPEIEQASDLADLTARLNGHVHRKSEPESFISFFIGIVERGDENIIYANAGHNPPFLLDSRGRVRTLDGTGMCLGMFPSMKYETATAPFPHGDLLCLYTDGITEAMNGRREQFSEERLVSVIMENASLPAKEIIAKAYEAVSEFTGTSHLEDDITLVILKRK